MSNSDNNADNSDNDADDYSGSSGRQLPGHHRTMGIRPSCRLQGGVVHIRRPYTERIHQRSLLERHQDRNVLHGNRWTDAKQHLRRDRNCRHLATQHRRVGIRKYVLANTSQKSFSHCKHVNKYIYLFYYEIRT